MALMDSKSSEALARRVSGLISGQTLKSWPLRLGGFDLAGGKWWSMARSAACCAQVSRTGELKKPAHPKVPYAQPPSNSGTNTCLTDAHASSITSERLNPITDGQ
jgi:hypothetical protein